MKGSNTLIFNEASMIEAIQEYLAKRITLDTPKVVSIKPSDRNLNLFQIDIQEDEHGNQNNSK